VRVLVTGAAGFVGAHLVAALERRGHETVAVDCFTSFHPRDLKERRWSTLTGKSSNDVLNIDVCDVEATSNPRLAVPFDAVVHLAAQSGVRYSERHPETCVRSNVLGTYSVLALASRLDVPRVIYASSSSVYGDTSGECREEDLSVAPTSLYGVTKRSGELIARAFWERQGLRSVGVRLFTSYGDWGRPDMAYFRMIVAALTGTEFPLLADLSVRRDFTYIADTINVLVALVEREGDFPDPATLVNVGGGAPCSLQALKDVVQEITGRELRMRQQPPTLGDVTSTCASTQRMTELSLPIPTTSIVEGISQVVEWITPLISDARDWVAQSE